MRDDVEYDHDITAKGAWLVLRFLIKYPLAAIQTIPKLLELGLNDYLVDMVLFITGYLPDQEKKRRKP